MGIMEKLQELTESPWTGICILPPGHRPRKNHDSMRLCEALVLSFRETVRVRCQDFSCAGARRSFGLAEDEVALALGISRAAGIPSGKVLRLLAQRPRLALPADSVQMGNIDSPDLLASFMHPEAAMRLLRAWQAYRGEDAEVGLTTFLAICSCVAEGIQRKELLFSLGCPKSRQVCGLSPNTLFAVLPAAAAKDIIEEAGYHANL